MNAYEFAVMYGEQARRFASRGFDLSARFFAMLATHYAHQAISAVSL